RGLISLITAETFYYLCLQSIHSINSVVVIGIVEKSMISVRSIKSITKQGKNLWKSLWIKSVFSSLSVNIRRFAKFFHKHSQSDNHANVENTINLFAAIN